MSAGEVSLAQIAASGIAIAWYEAVAIVQEICRLLPDQPGQPVLDWSSVYVQPSGEISIPSGASGGADVSVPALGELLRAWLADAPYPMPLRMVVAQATCTPPFYGSTKEFSEALSHYERSNRQELIRGVYEHWKNANAASVESPADEHSAASSAALRQKLQTRYEEVAARTAAVGESARSAGGELLRRVGERLKSRRTPGTEPAPEPESTPEPMTSAQEASPPRDIVREVNPEIELALSAFRREGEVGEAPLLWLRSPVLNARVVSIAAAAMLVVAAGWLIAPGFGRSETTTASNAIGRADNRIVNALSSVFSAGLNFLGRYPIRTAVPVPGSVREGPLPPPTEAAEPPPAPAVLSTPPKRDVKPRAQSPPAQPRGGGAGVPAAPVRERAAPVQTSALDTAQPAEPDRPVIDTPAVYSAADADVTPPAAIEQQLVYAPPSDAQPQDGSLIEIVVDETGRVVSATVAKRPSTLQEAMQATMNLSAAKSWLFRPALKAGRPVKYRRSVWLANR